MSRRAPAPASLDALPLRDRLALERTRLANERTLLAYLRTALALFAGGATLLYLNGRTFVVVGLGLLAAGGLATLVGLLRFARARRRILRLETTAAAEEASTAP